MIALAALDLANGIGREGQLLQPISADLKRFKAMSLGKVVLYGRKTLDTFPGQRALPDRVNLILSRSMAADAVHKAEIFPCEEALLQRLEALRSEGYADDDFLVIGGASVYRQFLPHCHALAVTRIDAVYPADTFFPDPAMNGFLLEKEEDWLEEKGIRFRYEHWRRV